MNKLRRSMLFIPGNTPVMVQNGGVLDADSIILDLEDAVSVEEKDSARILVRNAIKQIRYFGVEIVVRTNPIDSGFGIEDIQEIARVKPHMLMIPKATEKDLKQVDRLLTEIEKKEGCQDKKIGIFPIIETAEGVENIYQIIKASDRVEGVLFGAEDLTADLGIIRTREGEEIAYARSKIVNACRALGVDAIDTPYTNIEDYEGFIKDVHRGKKLGMTGKAAINPRQVDDINQIFLPMEDEILYAQRVVRAMENAKSEGKGVFTLEGKMIDAPIVIRAQKIIEKAELAGLL